MLSKKIKSIIISVTMCVSLLFSGTVFASSNVNVTRLAGQDRYETNSKIIDAGWSKADSVILCNSTMYADAIVCSPLSKKLDAPILLTDGNTLSETAKNKIQSLGAKNIYIIGGNGVISKNIEDSLKSQGLNTTRIAGANRYETSLEVAKQLGSSSTEAFILDGNDWQDALTVSPIASKKGYPIILTDGNTQDIKLQNYFKHSGTCETFTGKEAFVDKEMKNPGIMRACMGETPIDIEKKAIKLYGNIFDFSNIYIASNDTFADALSGSALASKNGNPIILVDNNNQNDAKSLIDSNKTDIKSVNVLGGSGAVSDSLVSNVSGDSINQTPIVNPSQDSSQSTTTPIPTQSTDTQTNNTKLTLNDFYDFVGNNSYTNKIKNLVANINPNDINSIEVNRSGYQNNIESILFIKNSPNNIAEDAFIGIGFDKEEGKISITMANPQLLSKQTTDAFYNYGTTILSIDYNDMIKKDLVKALTSVNNIVEENNYDIKNQISNKTYLKIYSSNCMPYPVYTYYGSYEYGVEVFNGKIEVLIGAECPIKY